MRSRTVTDQEQLVQIGVPCQLEAFPAAEPFGAPSREEPWSWYLRRRARSALRRLGALVQRVLGRAPTRPPPSAPLEAPDLRAGDRVRVRSAEYIRSTLVDGRLSGCAFGQGMFQYCGKELRVARVVERFFDEARFRMLKARRMVLLEGVHCEGADLPDTQRCDRMCFYFWRTEWLEELPPRPTVAGVPDSPETS